MALLGAASAGLPSTPVNHQLDGDQLRYIVRQLRRGVVVAGQRRSIVICEWTHGPSRNGSGPRESQKSGPGSIIRPAMMPPSTTNSAPVQ
jgi:hypothetical protein